MKNLELILKEEWLSFDTWHILDLQNQRNFHNALERIYKELDFPPSINDFIFISNSITNNASKKDMIISFAKKAELMFNYYKIIS